MLRQHGDVVRSELAAQASVLQGGAGVLAAFAGGAAAITARLAAVGAAQAALRSQLPRLYAVATGTGDLVQFIRGYCAISTTRGCDGDGDCAAVGGGACIGHATQRCAAAAGTACSTDDDCAPGDRCLTDRGRLEALNTTLSLLGAADVDAGIAAGTAALSTLLPIAHAAGNVSAAAAGAQATGGARAAAVCGMRARIMAGRTALLADGVSTAFSGGMAAVTSALASVPAMPGLSSWRAQAGAIDPGLVAAGVGAAGVVRMLMTSALPRLAVSLSAPSLRPLAAAAGPGAVLRRVADELDAVIAVASKQRQFPVPAVSLAAAVSAPAALLDIVAGGDGAAASFGAAHLLATLAANATVLGAPYEGAATLRYNAAGLPYPDGRLCLTTACLVATAAQANTVALADALEVGGAVSVPLSRQFMMLLLWVPLVLVAALGAWALTARRCCRNPQWQKAPASCLVGVQVCCLPPLLLVTALVLAVAIPVTDICTYGRGVAANWMAVNGAALCTSVLGGTGDGASCAVNVSVPLPGAAARFVASVSLDAAVRGLAGGECSVAGRDPLLGAVAAALTAAANLTAADVPSWVASRAAGAGMALGPAATTLLHAVAADAASVMATAVLPVLHPTLACPTASRLLDSLEGALCTSLLPPLFWLALPWVGAAVLMLTLGIPAALLGRKRWVSVMWGPAYDAYVASRYPRPAAAKPAPSPPSAASSVSGGGSGQAKGSPSVNAGYVGF